MYNKPGVNAMVIKTLFSRVSTALTLAFSAGCMSINMPGKSYSGPIEFSAKEKALSKELKRDVAILADEIGERNLEHYDNLCKSAEFIKNSFKEAGYKVRVQEYKAPKGILSRSWKDTGYEDQVYCNIEAEAKGAALPEEIIIVGAHYDSAPVPGCRAANDNASGVAATLALARHFAAKKLKRTIRFVAFANEEPPFFWTKAMGSYVYAKDCKEKKEKIVAMLTPETIGYYSSEEKSQKYPFPVGLLYPSKGDFIAFVGNSASSDLVKKCVKTFRETTNFPSQGGALPIIIPRIGASDQWSFWQMGYPGLMVTDTAPYRYPFYHTSSDDPDKLDYDSMAKVVFGLEQIIGTLANE